jgi:hypothetical protein
MTLSEELEIIINKILNNEYFEKSNKLTEFSTPLYHLINNQYKIIPYHGLSIHKEGVLAYHYYLYYLALQTERKGT